MRQLAGLAALASGYLPMVLSGKRALSNKALHKLLPFLKLRPDEKKALELLVQLTEAPSAQSRAEILQRLQRNKNFRDNNKKEIETHKYLNQWYFVAIREMCLLKEFKSDPKWITERLEGRISEAQVKEALDFLVENNFVTKDKMAAYKAIQRKLSIAKKASSNSP